MSLNHPEWRVENSLTAPQDRDPSRTYRPNQSAPELTNQEVDNAMNDLNVVSFVKKYPAVERRYADPPIQMQNYGLFSFVPSKNAKPDEKGIYGFAKIRGCFNTTIEANEQAERIIRNTDSYHKIFHTYVGRPFPVTVSSDYSAETNEVDLKKDMSETMSNDIKQKRSKEEQDIKEIKEREEMLLKDVKLEHDDPQYIEDNYITLRVKKAQISWTYLETQKKLQEMRDIIIKTRAEIEKLDEENPNLKNTYMDKYMEARKQSGLSREQHGDNFIKFMVEDANLGF